MGYFEDNIEKLATDYLKKASVIGEEVLLELLPEETGVVKQAVRTEVNMKELFARVYVDSDYVLEFGYYPSSGNPKNYRYDYILENGTSDGTQPPGNYSEKFADAWNRKI